jgi:rubrerythrin
MPLLTREPPGAVHSLAELFAIAFALEQEAATRYRELAEKMREHGLSETAAVFEHLAQAERDHCDQVAHWSQQRTGHPPELAEVRWELPETFDDESAGELAGSRLATPYRALSMAVRNEERAFAFWTYVAAQAEDPAVRETAESMAREELEHVSLLRRERRHAYHAHRALIGKPVPRAAGGGRDILVAARRLEELLADQLGQLARARPAVNRARLESFIAESRQMAAEIASLGAAKGPVWEAGALPTEPIATAELLVERYLEAADHAKEEATLAQAQSLARKAIARLAWLRSSDRASRNNRVAGPEGKPP